MTLETISINAHITNIQWSSDHGNSIVDCQSSDNQLFRLVGQFNPSFTMLGMLLTCEGVWQIGPSAPGVFAAKAIEYSLPSTHGPLTLLLCSFLRVNSDLCQDVSNRFGVELWHHVRSAPEKLINWFEQDDVNKLYTLDRTVVEAHDQVRKVRAANIVASARPSQEIMYDPFLDYLHKRVGSFPRIFHESKHLNLNEAIVLRAAIVAAIRKAYVISGWTSIQKSFLISQIFTLTSLSITKVQLEAILSGIDNDLVKVCSETLSIPELYSAEIAIVDSLLNRQDSLPFEETIVFEDSQIDDAFNDWPSGIQAFRQNLKKRISVIHSDNKDDVDTYIAKSTQILREALTTTIVLSPLPIHHERAIKWSSTEDFTSALSFFDLKEYLIEGNVDLFNKDGLLNAEFVFILDCEWSNPQDLIRVLEILDPTAHVTIVSGDRTSDRVVGAVNRDIMNVVAPIRIDQDRDIEIHDGLSRAVPLCSIACEWEDVRKLVDVLAFKISREHSVDPLADIHWLIPDQADVGTRKRSIVKINTLLEEKKLIPPLSIDFFHSQFRAKSVYIIERHFEPSLPTPGTRVIVDRVSDNNTLLITEVGGSQSWEINESQAARLSPGWISSINECPPYSRPLAIFLAFNRSETLPLLANTKNILWSAATRQTILLGNVSWAGELNNLPAPTNRTTNFQHVPMNAAARQTRSFTAKAEQSKKHATNA